MALSSPRVCQTQVLVLAGCRVVDLNIGGDIAVTISLAEVVEVLVRDLAHIKLVVSGSEHIIIDSLVGRQYTGLFSRSERVGSVRSRSTIPSHRNWLRQYIATHLKDRIAFETIWFCGIAQSGTIMKVLSTSASALTIHENGSKTSHTPVSTSSKSTSYALAFERMSFTNDT